MEREKYKNGYITNELYENLSFYHGLTYLSIIVVFLTKILNTLHRYILYIYIIYMCICNTHIHTHNIYRLISYCCRFSVFNM